MPQSTSPVNELVNSVETLQEAIVNANEPTSAEVREWKAKLIILYEKLVLIEAQLDKEKSVEVEPPVNAPSKTSGAPEQIDKDEDEKGAAEPESPVEHTDKVIESSPGQPAENAAKSGLFSSTETEASPAAASDETPSLNDRFESEANELAEQLKKAPISDLRSAIGVNQRVSFIFELFENDSAAFDAALDHINEVTDLDAAMQYMVEELRTKYHWDEKEGLSAEFQQLVSRKFL